MSDKTKIEWSDATWNPLRGCQKVSEGCRNCYAARLASRFSGEGMPYEGLAEMTEHGPRWTGKIRLVPEVLKRPLKWKRPRKIFVNSMSDLFHEDVPFEYIDRVFAVMALASQHTFQILTKRPERMLEYMNDYEGYTDKLGPISEYMQDEFGWVTPEDIACFAPPGSTLPKWPKWPLPNVWIGVSVENQKAADERIPLLLQTPAAVRFLSMEPLLGPVDLESWMPDKCAVTLNPAGHPLSCGDCDPCLDTLKFKTRWQDCIHWIITGGESGPGARPMHPDWVRGIRDQCQAAGVAFHFKQWGQHIPFSQIPEGFAIDGNQSADLESDSSETFLRVGKKAAGRLLDGREWNEFPEVGT